jgi:hypothetical protein
MWIVMAFTVGLHRYGILTRNPVSFGVGLGVARSFTVAGVVLGMCSARTQGGDSSASGNRQFAAFDLVDQGPANDVGPL